LIPIGQNVKRLRAAAGMTQQDLAVAAGLSTSVVSQIEQGTNADPRMNTLAALAKALGVSVDELMREGPAPPAPQAEPPLPKPKKGTRKRKGK
jgi:transcriptional regulator with XRE-family HTH domain